MKKKSSMSSFTSGAQLFMHTLRMMNQGLKSSGIISGFLSLGWFIFRFFQKLSWSDIYYLLYIVWANVKLAIGSLFYAPYDITINVYDLTLQAIRHLRVEEYLSRIWKGNIGARLLTFGEWFSKNALFELIVVFALGMTLTYIFFIIQGRKSIVKQKTRGNELVSPSSLSRILKKNKAASTIKMAGLPLVKDSERLHILVTGTTGTGKTNLLHELLPQIREKGDRAIVVDVNGSFIGPYFKEGSDILLNPFDKRGSDWLPWADCTNSYDYDSIAEAIAGAPSHHDSFWEESAKKVIAEILKKTEGTRSIKKILEVINTYPLESYSNYFAGTNVAAITNEKGDKTTLSIRATISNKIHVLSCLKETKEPFSIKDYILKEESKNWLFLSSTTAQRKTLTPLLASWIEIALNGFMQRDPMGDNKNIWLIMDELPAMGKIPSLKTALAEARKYGGCLVAGVQNIHQFIDIYGRSLAMNLLDQFNTRFIFRVGDQETAQMSSKLLGAQEIEETKESFSYGANTMRDGVNLNTVEKKQELVMPTEIMTLAPLTCYVKLAGHWPITKLSMQYQRRVAKNKIFVD